MKKYVLIAGVNGAGKSTLYESIKELKAMNRVNTDEIVRKFGTWKSVADMVAAGKIAIKKRKIFLEKGESFNQETTLCGKSIMHAIHQAKECGYFVEMHYVGVESIDIAKQRVAYRVKNGGHGIPEKDIERRYFESFKQVNKIMSEIDLLVFYDNTENFKRFAIFKKGKLIKKSKHVPDWFEKYIMV